MFHKKARLFLSFIFLYIYVQQNLAQTIWHTPFNEYESFVDGRFWNNENRENYNRLPLNFAKKVRKALWELSTNSSGLYINFKTNSPDIIIKYTVTGNKSLPNVGPMATSGIDLYQIDNGGKANFCSCFGRFHLGDKWFSSQSKDTIIYRFNNLARHGNSPQLYRLYLPLYNTVSSLQIGTNANNYFSFEERQREKPIVIYGTSISQGASASRPGMSWSNILQRSLNKPIYNFGFSGNGKLEPELFHILSEIDARIYIIDCMPNMTNFPDSIGPRLINGIKILRQKRDCPILLVEHDGYTNWKTDSNSLKSYARTNQELRKTFLLLKKNGVNRIFYMTEKEIGISQDTESQIDGVHATDIGMRLYANAYKKKLKKILRIK